MTSMLFRREHTYFTLQNISVDVFTERNIGVILHRKFSLLIESQAYKHICHPGLMSAIIKPDVH